MKLNFRSITHSVLITTILTCAGCSTLNSAYDSAADTVSGWVKSDKKDNKEVAGASHTYPYEYESVYNATIAVAKNNGLKVIENDKENGRLILSHGISIWSLGENITVAAKPIPSNSTVLEITSKPKMYVLNAPTDWEAVLFDEIDIELRGAK